VVFRWEECFFSRMIVGISEGHVSQSPPVQFGLTSNTEVGVRYMYDPGSHSLVHTQARCFATENENMRFLLDTFRSLLPVSAYLLPCEYDPVMVCSRYRTCCCEFLEETPARKRFLSELLLLQTPVLVLFIRATDHVYKMLFKRLTQNNVLLGKSRKYLLVSVCCLLFGV
jgi:hypothetical protein